MLSQELPLRVEHRQTCDVIATSCSNVFVTPSNQMNVPRKTVVTKALNNIGFYATTARCGFTSTAKSWHRNHVALSTVVVVRTLCDGYVAFTLYDVSLEYRTWPQIFAIGNITYPYVLLITIITMCFSARKFT